MLVAVWICNEFLKYVVQVFTRVDVVPQAGREQGKHYGRVFSSLITTKEIPIFATCGKHLHLLFCQIIVCALARCTGYVGTKSHPATLAPAGSTQSESGGDK